MPTVKVGNEFVIVQPQMETKTSTPVVTVSPQESIPPGSFSFGKLLSSHRLNNTFHRRSLAVFAVLLLIIGVVAIQVAAHYWTSKHITKAAQSVPVLKTTTRPIAGFNTAITSTDLPTKLQTITSQPATLSVGSQAVPVGADTIRGWLQITSNKAKSMYYVHVNEASISASLTKLANRYVKAPVNQVTISEDGVNRVVAAGRNGTALADPNGLAAQAHQIAKTVLNSKGMQFSTPLQTTPFQAVTPAAFGKLLVANVSTKKMYAFQNGQQVNNWLVSAGKPSTPTPLGQFHIYAKFSVQDMRGTNPDGTPYSQPHVRWVNYFSAGSAIHGVYWHPLSWFGANNSSHGCIGIPDNEAKWIYDWASVGTTVITHA